MALQKFAFGSVTLKKSREGEGEREKRRTRRDCCFTSISNSLPLRTYDLDFFASFLSRPFPFHHTFTLVGSAAPATCSASQLPLAGSIVLFHFTLFSLSLSLPHSSGPNYRAVESVYCSTHRSLGLLLLCASEAHKGRMEWKRMCALHKLRLIGLKESGGDKKGRGRRKRGGGDVLLWNKLGKKSAALHFLNWPAEMWAVVLLFYSNTESHYHKNF